MPLHFDRSLAQSFRDTDSFPLDRAFEQLFPGYESYSQSEKQLDRQGSDVQIQLGNRTIHADLKFRSEDPRLWGEDDLAVELLSVVEKGIRGYANQRTDYLIWVFKRTGRIVSLPFEPFKRFYQQNWSYWHFWRAEKPAQTITESGGSYHSLHCLVPFKLVAGFATEVQIGLHPEDQWLN